MEVFPERMQSNMDLSYGVVFSQSLLLALCDKGLTREEAYAIVQRIAHKALDEKKMFQDLVKQDAEVKSHLPADEITKALDPVFFLKHVDAIFDRIGLNM